MEQRYSEQNLSEGLKLQISTPSAIATAEDQALLTGTTVRKKIASVETQSEPELPVMAFREEILQKIAAHPITIVTAETGAGKSTQVPQFLLDEGYEVIVTQPRRMAARGVATRIAEERGGQIGQEVGYRTAEERKESKDTKLLVCTDGLQLVRELTGKGIGQGKKTALVLDEVHEWNVNMEVLVAWVRQQIQQGGEFKVVLMSATLDSQTLSAFMETGQHTAPVVEVPGRMFPVEERVSNRRNMLDEVSTLARQGRNVLAFFPGKKEIQEAELYLQTQQLDAEILPLHGELSAEVQDRVFRSYTCPKIVLSTNVAQTSITIEDIDAVVDSQLERRIETIDGVEGLHLKLISHADSKQRKGRAGRCRPGIYVRCTGEIDRQEEFPKPEIQRVRLDQMVLRLAATGLDAVALEFFHQPPKNILEDAKRTLQVLGAMDASGQVTSIGKEMSRMPLSVHTSRMVIEALRHECVDLVLQIAACLEAGGIRNRRSNNWRRLTTETQSDALAELDCFLAARGMNKKELENNGIMTKNYFRAREIRGHLYDGLRKAGIPIKAIEQTVPKEAILKSIVAGMIDHLAKKEYADQYIYKGSRRTLAKESIVRNNPEWIVALPIDIQFTNKRGRPGTLELLQFATEVDIEWLPEIAPHLIEVTRSKNVEWSQVLQGVANQEVMTCNGTKIKETEVVAEKTEKAHELFLYQVTRWSVSVEGLEAIEEANKQTLREMKELMTRSGGTFTIDTARELQAQYRRALEGTMINTIAEFKELLETGVVAPEAFLLHWETYISPEERRRLEEANPTEVHIQGNTYNVRYVHDYSGMYRYITVKEEDIHTMTQADVDAAMPTGKTLEIMVDGHHHRAKSVASMQETIEKSRVDKKWGQFIEAHVPAQVSEENFQNILPELEVFDEVTGALAYPTYRREWGSWVLRWVRDKEEAEMYAEKAHVYIQTHTWMQTLETQKDLWYEMEYGKRQKLFPEDMYLEEERRQLSEQKQNLLGLRMSDYLYRLENIATGETSQREKFQALLERAPLLWEELQAAYQRRKNVVEVVPLVEKVPSREIPKESWEYDLMGQQVEEYEVKQERSPEEEEERRLRKEQRAEQKRQEREAKKQQKQSFGAELIPVVELSEEAYLEEYESNEQRIAEIHATNEGLKELMTTWETLQQQYTEGEQKLQDAIARRDLAQGTALQRFQNQVTQLRERRTTLKTELKKLEGQVQEVRPLHEELVVLQGRQTEIEARMFG